MSLANLSIAYERMRQALEECAFEPGEWEEVRHIDYCRWCGYSREWIAKYGHEGCILARSSPSGEVGQ